MYGRSARAEAFGMNLTLRPLPESWCELPSKLVKDKTGLINHQITIRSVAPATTESRYQLQNESKTTWLTRKWRYDPTSGKL